MALKIEPIILDGLNYAISKIDMEMLLKNKGLQQYMKVSLLDPRYDQAKFVIEKKKDEAEGRKKINSPLYQEHLAKNEFVI